MLDATHHLPYVDIRMSNLQVATTQQQPLSAFSSENAFVSVQRMAKALASSTLVPDSYRGEANLGNCIIALELSQRIGASVMAVMQSMVPIHGKPTWSAAFLIATVNSCGRFSPMRFRWVGKEGTDDWGCRAYAVEREGNLELVGALVTIAMAKAEGWYGKSGSKWKTMPEQMLQYRAAAFWTRAYAPEIALGMHTSEEVHDTQAAQQVVQPSVATTVTASVVDVTPTPPEPKPRRKKVEPEPVAVVEPTPEPVAEPEPAPAPVEPAAEETAESTLAQIGITYAQLAKLATDLEWWPDADTYPTTQDLPPEIQQWVIRNKRGIARAVQKAGGAL